MSGMDAPPPPLMSFTTLDEAESALDWIGVDFTERVGAFDGELVPDDRELLDEVLADPETPAPVRELAGAFVSLQDAAGPAASAAWSVAFTV
jgi:hypothetical protein